MFRHAIIALFAILLLPLAARAGGIAVHEPYARPPLGAGKVAAAYMTLKNAAAQPDRLIAARGDVADRIELHTHIREQRDGQVVMKMRQVPHIEVPAEGQVQLRPGGYHIMLIGVKRPLKPGDVFDLVLVFENAGEVKVRVPVRRLADTMKHRMQSGRH